MSLTKHDLLTIAQIVQNAIRVEVPPIVRAIVKKESERIMLATAAGFSEVHQRIDGLQTEVRQLSDSIDRIEHVQRAEVDRSDRHGLGIARLNRELGLL